MPFLNNYTRGPKCWRLVLIAGLGLALCLSRPANCEELRRKGRRLLWGQKPVHLVGYSYYGLMGDREFDSEAFLEVLAAHNINFTRFFLILPWPVEPGPNMLPFGKVGEKYDLRQFDDRFFVRLRSLVVKAERLGIICQVVLFDRCGLNTGDRLAWTNNPYNSDCNINGLLKGPANGYPAFCRCEGPIAEINAAYIKKVAETIGDCNNVIYDIINEPYPQLGDLAKWHAWVASELRKNLSGRSGSKVISAGESRSYQDKEIDLSGMHSASHDHRVAAAVQQSKDLNKPLILSDDGDAPCMFNPEVTTFSAKRALELGQHFEHLEFTITRQRERENRPASYYYQLSGLCQLNLRNLSRLSKPLILRPYVSSASVRKTSAGGVFSAKIENAEKIQRVVGEQSSDGGRTWSQLPVEVYGDTVKSKAFSLGNEVRTLVRVVCIDKQSRRWAGPIYTSAPANGWAVQLGAEIIENGIFRVRPNAPDGVVQPAILGGQACYQVALDKRGKYAYFRLEDSFPRGRISGPVTIEVEYFDETSDSRLILEYDGRSGPYTAAAPVSLEGSGAWKSASFTVQDASFKGRENDGADFRFSLQNSKAAMALRSVSIHDSANAPSAQTRLEAPRSVKRFDPAEFVVRVEQPTFKNPFTDVELTGEFVPAGGTAIRVEGFADSQDGSVFRLRFCPELADVTYEYSLRLQGIGIDRRFGGKLLCEVSDRAGPVIVDPQHPKHFIHAGSRKPFHHLGYTAYHLLDPSNDDAQVDATIDYCRRHGFNKIRFLLTGYPRDNDKRPVTETPYVPPKGNPWRVPNYGSRPGQVNPLPAWVGEPHDYDFTRFNVAYWQRIDRAVRRMRDHGIVATCIFTIEKQNLPKEYGRLTEAEYLLYRYAVARLAAFDNVWWDLGNEYQDYRDEKWPDIMGPFVRKADPYDRLTSVHDQQEFLFSESNWADFIIVQQDRDGQSVHDWALKYQSVPKPYINEEYGYEGNGGKPGHGQNSDWTRRSHWSTAMAGGYATYGDWSNGVSHFYMGEPGRGEAAKQLRHLRTFFESLPFNELIPHDELTTQGFCLAKPPEHYVFHLPRGGGTEIDLTSATDGKLVAQWFDPRTGEYRAGPDVQEGKTIVTAPPGDDMVLYIRNDNADNGKHDDSASKAASGIAMTAISGSYRKEMMVFDMIEFQDEIFIGTYHVTEPSSGPAKIYRIKQNSTDIVHEADFHGMESVYIFAKDPAETRLIMNSEYSGGKQTAFKRQANSTSWAPINGDSCWDIFLVWKQQRKGLEIFSKRKLDPWSRSASRCYGHWIY